MDKSGTEIQLNPPLPPPTIATQTPQVDFYSHTTANPNYYVHFSQSQSPDPFPDHHYFPTTLNAQEFQPVPPGVDPVQSVAVNPIASTNVSSSRYEAPQLGLAYSSYLTVGLHSAAVPVDYQDPNQNVALASCGFNPYGAGVILPSTAMQNLVTANPDCVLWTKETISSESRNTSKKAPKKIKIVQSVWCEVCRIDCNSKNVLDKHKLGKKHKKNLEKLIIGNTSVLAHSPVLASVPRTAATVSGNPVIGPQGDPTKAKFASNPAIGPQENPVKANYASSQTAQKKAACADDLETKRKRVLEGGAAADAVRTCAICNVVCNSETVFRYHLQGQKHATRVKQLANATRLAAET